jgi:hypothetical protein
MASRCVSATRRAHADAAGRAHQRLEADRDDVYFIISECRVCLWSEPRPTAEPLGFPLPLSGFPGSNEYPIAVAPAVLNRILRTRHTKARQWFAWPSSSLLAFELGTNLHLAAADAATISIADPYVSQFCTGCAPLKDDGLQIYRGHPLNKEITTPETEACEDHSPFDCGNRTDDPTGGDGTGG